MFANPSVSVHEKAALFDSIFEKCLDRHAPIKKVKVYSHYKRGLSQETIKLIRERDKARLDSIRASDCNKQVLAIKYRTLRNKVISKTSETRFFIAVPEFVSRYLFLNFAKFE